MGIHVGIFLVLFVLWFAYRRKWKLAGFLRDQKGRRLFFLVAVAGNLMGMAVSIQNRQPEEVPQVFQKEQSDYEQELIVAVEGEDPKRITVEIPGKELGEEEEMKVQKSVPSLEQQIQEEILRCNEGRDNEEIYYLPQKLNGQKLVWGFQQDHSGTLLAFLCLGVGGCLLVIREREKEEARRQLGEAFLMDYPGLVMKFTMFIQAGLSVQEAFHRIAGDYEKRKNQLGKSPAYEEIRKTCLEMDSGVSQVEAYRHFGQRCGQLKYRTFSTLLIQNLQKGSQGLLDMLEKESIDAWEDRKRKAKVAGETAATKLLIPMVLMLGVVLALLIIPACLSFYTG